jgi:U4/U6.U5 tri-snRNP component SNU23
MASNLNYKQVANVNRRTWDAETYEKKAKARQENEETKSTSTNDSTSLLSAATKAPEFQPATAGAAGPEGSDRAYLKARESHVNIDDKVGTTELIAPDASASSSTKDGVVKTGVGWHCKVCECFLKDSLTYLDHINGRKHQRKLGYSMQVKRSTKDELQEKLATLLTKKNEEKVVGTEEVTDFDEIVKQKDEAAKRRKEEREQKRKERKEKSKQQEQQVVDDDEEEAAAIDPVIAAMMGFSGFGGGK